MAKPTISVAMATYNGATYLREQLDSIAVQRHLPIELVIGDDGSSDGTIEIAKAFAVHAPFPVRILRNAHNLGFADNFLCTAERCIGEWIAFCDQDDVWYPDKLARIASEIEARGEQELVMVCHVADVVDSTLAKTGRRMPTIERTHVSPANSQPGFWCMGGCVMVVRGDLVREIDFRCRPPDDYLLAHKIQGQLAPMAHDKWMSVLANAMGESLFLAEALACYRRHETAVTGAVYDVPVAKRMHQTISTGSEFYRFRAEMARRSAAALRTMAIRLDDQRAGRLKDSARRFDAMNANFEARAGLYDQASVLNRLRGVAILARHRAYFGDRFSRFGGMSLLKDLAFCFARGSLGKRSSELDRIAP